MNRLTYGIRNAKVVLVFNLLFLGLNFFSRRVFLDHLGEELVGLSAAVMNFIGLLNLADLGISTAIVNALYRPLFQKDREEIQDIVSLFGYLFRWIGGVIFIGGGVLIAVTPWLFADKIGAGELDVRLIYAAFGTFLFTTLLSYWANYKQHLLVADQRGYWVNGLFQGAAICKTLVQMGLLVWWGMGYETWLAVEVVFGILYSLGLTWAVRHKYPWLRSSIRQGRAVMKKYGAVFVNVKRVFAQKIAGFVQERSSVIILSLIYPFHTVAFYTNYTLIGDRIVKLIVGSLTNSYAGVGNLVAEGDGRKIRLVFDEFTALYYWLGAVVAFGFFGWINPFLPLWLKAGGYELFSTQTVALLAVSLFITFVRQPMLYFTHAYGLFGDVWAGWTEAGLSVVLSVLLGWKLGVVGVVVGAVVGAGLNVLIWKPYFLFRRGFGASAARYYGSAGKYLVVLGALAVGAYRLTSAEWLPAVDSWGGWAVNALAVTALYGAASAGAMYLVSPGFRALVRLGLQIIRK